MVITLLLTVFTLALIPVYYKQYGPQNFLWFSDIGLFLTVGALWLRSPFIMNIAILFAFPFEILWNIDFAWQLITGRTLVGLAGYMFVKNYPFYVRLLSLFHIFLPIIWIWTLVTWGYDQHALVWAVLVCWVTLIVTYLFTDPKENINWVFLPEQYNWRNLTRKVWFGILMIVLPLIYWVMHLLLSSYAM